MTAFPPLRTAAAAGQLADLGTYWIAPSYEANPVLTGQPPILVLSLKLLLVVFVVAWSATSVRDRNPALIAAALVFVAIVGAFGCGANVATLSLVAR